MDPEDRPLHDPSPGDATGPAAGGAPDRRFALRRGHAVLLEADGFRIVGGRRRRAARLHPFTAIADVVASHRMLLIGLETGLIAIRNHRFEDPERDPGELRRLLLERVAALADGPARIARIEAIERLATRRAFGVATWTMVVLCLLGTAVQLRDPLFEQVGAFVPELFARGEYWRGITIHIVHGLSGVPLLFRLLFGDLPGLPLHLAVNVGGLLVLGHLVERPLGSWRTAMILAFSAVGTLAGILMAGHAEVIGASGLVSGLAGAILAMELIHPTKIPSPWRLPRRLFIGAIGLQFLVLDPILWRQVASGAHLGGFAGGFAGVLWLGGPSLEGLVPTNGLRVATYTVVSVLILGLAGAVPLTRHDMGALERHAIRLLNSPATPNLIRHDNAAAWFIATEGEASQFGLDLAIALADRAVEETGGAHPGILDTLAEALFQSGDRRGALVAIDEAIRLVPHETYFLEQRRRFTGERAPHDRPPPPSGEAWPDERFAPDPGPLPIDPESPTLTI